MNLGKLVLLVEAGEPCECDTLSACVPPEDIRSDTPVPCGRPFYTHTDLDWGQFHLPALVEERCARGAAGIPALVVSALWQLS